MQPIYFFRGGTLIGSPGVGKRTLLTTITSLYPTESPDFLDTLCDAVLRCVCVCVCACMWLFVLCLCVCCVCVPACVFACACASHT